MGHFAWFVTTCGTGGLTDALRDKIAEQVQRELSGGGTQTVPRKPSGLPATNGQKMYLTEERDWVEYRHYAKLFPSKDSAEAVAFEIASKSPEFLGKVGVEKLWYEPPAMKFNHGYGMVATYRPAFDPVRQPSLSDFLTEDDLKSDPNTDSAL